METIKIYVTKHKVCSKCALIHHLVTTSDTSNTISNRCTVLLALCLAMAALLIVNLIHIGWMVPQPKNQVSQLTRTTQTKPHFKHGDAPN